MAASFFLPQLMEKTMSETKQTKKKRSLHSVSYGIVSIVLLVALASFIFNPSITPGDFLSNKLSGSFITGFGIKEVKESYSINDSFSSSTLINIPITGELVGINLDGLVSGDGQVIVSLLDDSSKIIYSSAKSDGGITAVTGLVVSNSTSNESLVNKSAVDESFSNSTEPLNINDSLEIAVNESKAFENQTVLLNFTQENKTNPLVNDTADVNATTEWNETVDVNTTVIINETLEENLTAERNETALDNESIDVPNNATLPEEEEEAPSVEEPISEDINITTEGIELISECQETCIMDAVNMSNITIAIEIIGNATIFVEDFQLTLLEVVAEPPVLVQNISDINMGSSYALNLNEYFAGATSYDVLYSDVNLETEAVESILSFNAVKNGTTDVVLIAINEEGNTWSNFFKVNYSTTFANFSLPLNITNVSLNISENFTTEIIGQVRVGEPVQWVKTGRGSIELPTGARGIEVKEKESGNAVLAKDFVVEYKGGTGIASGSRKKELSLNVDEIVEARFETPGPEKFEVNNHDGSKTVYVSSSEHYLNVVSFSTLEGMAGQDVSVYWEEESKYLTLTKAVDEGRDLYIEWIVPHLSTQTFVISINDNSEWNDGSFYNVTVTNSAITLTWNGTHYNNSKGIYVSDVFDAGKKVNWTNLTYGATTINYYGDSSDGDILVNSSGIFQSFDNGASYTVFPESTGTSFNSVQDGDMVVINARDFHVKSGVTVTTTNRCRGLMIYSSGTVEVNGTVSMTARGAHANPADSGVTANTPVAPSDGNAVPTEGLVIRRQKTKWDDINSTIISNAKASTLQDFNDTHNTSDLFYGTGTAAVAGESNQGNISNGLVIKIPRVGGAGGAGYSTFVGSCPGNDGETTSMGSGGGGSGSSLGSSGSQGGWIGSGTAGTCFSGGSGGGAGRGDTSGTNAALYGGAGGDAPDSQCGSGVGNPGGNYFTASGTGGLLVIIAREELKVTGAIESKGIDSLAAYRTGGASGGGVVVLLAPSSNITGTIDTSGGTGAMTTSSSILAGDGGDGALVGPIKIDSTSLLIETRTSDDNSNWGNWSANTQDIAFARYLQYRAIFTSEDSTISPSLNWVNVSYDKFVPRNYSLLFNGSSYLSWTPGSSGDLRANTISAWIKLVGTGSDRHPIFSADTDGTHYEYLSIDADDKLTYYFYDGTDHGYYQSNGLIRDYSDWIHVMLVKNASAGTVKLYINGKEDTSLGIAISNRDGYMSRSATTHLIGSLVTLGPYQEYLSNYYYLDGINALPSDFGYQNYQGKWVPKEYNGTYGTNGFYLAFNDSSNIGKDYSGNGNDWTANGFDLSKHQTYDIPEDNFATLNPLDHSASPARLFEGNLINDDAVQAHHPTSTIIPSSGKYYYELKVIEMDNPTYTFWAGFTGQGRAIQYNYPGFDSDSWGFSMTQGSANIGRYTGGANIGSLTASRGYQQGDVFGYAHDVDAGKVWLRHPVDGWFGDPEAGTGEAFSGLPKNVSITSSVQGRIGHNFGATDFTYSIPEGYSKLSSANLPNVSIANNSKYFGIVNYTGTGASQSIDVGFRPDLVWIKRTDSGVDHRMFDTVRGTEEMLSTNLNAAESTESNTLTSFNANGFTVGTYTATNNLNSPYIAWAWKADSAAGFSIFNYTGNGIAGKAVEHNLNGTPEMFIVKDRSNTGQWVVYNQYVNSSPETDYLTFETNDFLRDNIVVWNDQAPNSSHVFLGTSTAVNTNNDNFIGYAWRSIEGFSKLGSYTGNGNADGPFIYTGFKPKYLIIKKTSATEDWLILDSHRDSTNPKQKQLYANSNIAEQSFTVVDVDFLENGFKIRGNHDEINTNTGNYIYMAFGEYPVGGAVAAAAVSWQPVATNFGAGSTDFSGYDATSIQNVESLKLVKDSCGNIVWRDSVDATSADFDNYVKCDKGWVSVDSGNLDSSFNSPANVTIENFELYNPVVYKDGSLCTDCVVLFENSTTITFNVTGFSNYSLMGLDIVNVTDCMNLSQNNTAYVLKNNIIDSTDSVCFNVSGTNITFDGMNFIVDEDATANSYVFFTDRAADEFVNLTITNAELRDWRYGITLTDANNIYIHDLVLNGSPIEISSLSHVIIENITSINSLGNGMNFNSAGNITISNSQVNLPSGYGISGSYSTLNIGNTSATNAPAYDYYLGNGCGTLYFENFTGTGNKPILHFDKGVNIDGWNNNFSSMVLCNAHNSNITNVNFESTGRRNGILMQTSNNIRLTNSNFNNFRAIWLAGNNMFVSNITINDARTGFYTSNMDNSNFEDIKISNSTLGIHLQYSENNNFTNITTYNMADKHIHYFGGEGNTFNNSKFEIGKLLQVGVGQNNLIYNSIINVTTIGTITNKHNDFNSTLTESTNILGGSWAGGNVWLNPTGTGYSETCVDADYNGICDSAYVIDSNNTDYHALAYVPKGKTYLYDCANLSVDNSHYVLRNDILNSDYNDCFNINGSNIVFDGNGHTVQGNGSGNYGIYDTTAGSTNNTVRNFKLDNWHRGVAVITATNFYVYDTNISNTDNGILMNNAPGTRLYNVKVTNSNVGIRPWLFGDLIIYNADLSNNVQGIYSESSAFTIYNSTISSTSEDTFMSAYNSGGCSSFYNVTGSNGKKIVSYKTDKMIDGWNDNISRLILCGANFEIKNSNFSFEGMNGIIVSGTADVNFSNVRIANASKGIHVKWSTARINSTVFYNNSQGIRFDRHSGWVKNSNFSANQNGISLGVSTLVNVSNSRFSGTGNGIALDSGYTGNQSIYNNLFNTTTSIAFGSVGNSLRLNTTLTSGTNIIGGVNLGGNVWTNAEATGFSDTCVDANQDDICDTSYALNGANIDYLPLALPNPGTTYLNDCANLTENNTEYILTQDILNSNYDVCFNITGFNITFDGQGHTVQGMNENTGKAFAHVTAININTNLTIKNITVNKWQYGFYMRESEGHTINSVTITDTTTGLYIRDNDDSTLTNSKIDNVSFGLDMWNYLINYTIENVSISRATIAIAYDGGYGSIRNVNITNSSIGFQYEPEQRGYCQNDLQNIAVDGTPIALVRDIAALSNWYYNVSELIICNSTNAVLNNMSLNRISFAWSDGIEIHNSTFNNHYKPISAIGSNWMIKDTTVSNCIDTCIDSDQWTPKNLSFDNVSIINSSRYGIFTANAINTTVKNSYFANISTFALWDAEPGIKTTVLNSVFRNADRLRIGIDNIEYINNTFTGTDLYNLRYNNSLVGNTFLNATIDFAQGISRNISSTFYNNIFNGTSFTDISNTNISLNTTLTVGTNIIGNNSVGGNVWTNNLGTGFSDTCSDSNKDGICDSSYQLSAHNFDYLPLALPSAGAVYNGGSATLCDATHSCFMVENSSNAIVLRVDGEGDLDIKGSFTSGVGAISEPANSFVIESTNGKVAYIDSIGNIVTKGDFIQNATLSTNGDDFVIENKTGSTVGLIDGATGNFYFLGELHYNSNY